MAKKTAAWYGHDFGLSLRMFITMMLLAALYLAFIVVLWDAGVALPLLILIIMALAFSQYFFSDSLVLLTTGSRIVTPQQAPKLYAMVERLAQLADIPVPKIAVMPTRMPNAFTTGRSPKKATITVTQGLLDQLPEQELEAVLAHELTHIKNHDVAVITIASFFAMIAAFIVQQFFFFGFMAEEDRGRRGGQAIMVVWLVSVLVWAISYVLIRTLSRYREYAADRGSAILTGHPGYLASALQRINANMARTPQRDLRQAENFNAFFIFPAIRKDSLMEIFSTHPSLPHRIAYLQKMQEDMEK
ncbi:MAG: zinc metalloprotease HtpX [Sulfobacillus thermosulfidooxidans]|uniref:zinc metalloprotease HtpX n=1 Tax=Sulfobacillus sp. hq2 TaxID=2039167 RepID=UPI000CD15917|nr:zinc metalloprotease HtpX [Sulfobacillus sp. hq2]POB12138.1 zinc metalloprotease HtpX [Sulfobacillus sp. hq2]PSR36543.1 MAG: zinc metalloprotease HtpX [Sulfobacillus thermosulfidooxidans]